MCESKQYLNRPAFPMIQVPLHLTGNSRDVPLALYDDSLHVSLYKFCMKLSYSLNSLLKACVSNDQGVSLQLLPRGMANMIIPMHLPWRSSDNESLHH